MDLSSARHHFGLGQGFARYHLSHCKRPGKGVYGKWSLTALVTSLVGVWIPLKTIASTYKHIYIYKLKHNMIICGAKNYALQRNTVQCLLQVRSFPPNDEVCHQQFTNHPRRFLAPPLKHWKLNLGLKQGWRGFFWKNNFGSLGTLNWKKKSEKTTR